MFQVSSTSKLAIKIFVLLGSCSSENQMSLNELSKKLRVSKKYLQRILLKLQKSGLLKSIRGKKGGYVLPKPADQITILDILRVTENDLNLIDCLKTNGLKECPRANQCITRKLWQKVKTEIEEFAKSITIKDLLDAYEKFKVKSYIYHI
ncbi:RrF2 family transcriptional regulator [Pseudothermotoga thermarum]|uniref:Transcriptional regulator, BadM/Rrf2 family n=1 Tax=Pseudothermotoga thermarum DSM 5069 TaxID=688269 RepID=F7YV51_9THEM|nr:Rrf2 family transcriptional regulator [Pseudothermotoga thermarum]AEH50350.1 transcriptional regulator, BadM/Rrf2 family [Pseudothermotoga thermarum DSM 5069]